MQGLIGVLSINDAVSIVAEALDALFALILIKPAIRKDKARSIDTVHPRDIGHYLDFETR